MNLPRPFVLRAVLLSSMWLSLACLVLNAQSGSQIPQWQINAGGKMQFQTASVRRNTALPPKAVFFNFPLGPGDVYQPRGGVFLARNLPLSTYIEFAYKITPNQEQLAFSQMPKWVTTDRFDIQAKAEGNPTKDQMRLMMQTLLADRFRLAVHYETRQLPVLALIVDRPGILGPQLQQHPFDMPCPTTSIVPSPAPTAQPQLVDSRFPSTCGGILPMTPSAPGRYRSGARNVTMDLIASSFAEGDELDRPVVDKTGLTGKFDYALEYSPRPDGRPPSETNFRSDPSGPTLTQALQEQLGLKFESQTAPMNIVIVDYADALSLN
jgi:uncharacterized protein (TIGR03435 family)